MSNLQPNPSDVIIPVPVDDVLHTDTSPFCPADPSCGCHEDPTLIGEVLPHVQDGLMTPQEATEFTKGKLL